MNCNEMNFEHLVSLKAYPTDAVAYATPAQVVSKYINVGDMTVTESRGVELDFDHRTFKVTESMQRTASGVYCQDTFRWELNRPKEVDMEMIRKITRNPYHLRFAFLGGKVMWLRATEDGWDGGYLHDSESCRVELTATTPSGLQLLIEK